MIKEFTDIIAWQESHKLVLKIYKIKFPKEETYSLADQIRRAAVSITSNIAEGFGRQSYKEKIHFYYTAQGSLTEVKNQLIIAKDIGYLPVTEFTQIFDQLGTAHKLLIGLISKTKEFSRIQRQES